jgi:hypothetical protein
LVLPHRNRCSKPVEAAAREGNDHLLAAGQALRPLRAPTTTMSAARNSSSIAAPSAMSFFDCRVGRHSALGGGEMRPVQVADRRGGQIPVEAGAFRC